MWRKLDVAQTLPHYIAPDDLIYYAREYISGGQASASPCNQLILNFKKSPSRKGKPDWRYKAIATAQFARELASGIKDGAALAAIPSSKCKSDPEYDCRFEDLFARLKQLMPTVAIEWPFLLKTSVTSRHSGGNRRPDEFYDNLEWVGFVNPKDHIILVDDVITTGSGFVGAKRMINEHHPEMRVVGVFWGKTIWLDEA